MRLYGTVLILALGLGLLIPAGAWAHCDTMGGPVVATAQKALDKGDVTPVLKWVKADDEAQIRQAFKLARAVRKQGKQARELADEYFFETLVRIHRAGEGQPFTGLKPAASIEPITLASDKALESGNPDALVKEVNEAVAAGIRQRFERALAAKKDMDKSVDAGREYVEAYVTFTHYVEGLHLQATGAGGGEASHGH